MHYLVYVFLIALLCGCSILNLVVLIRSKFKKNNEMDDEYFNAYKDGYETAYADLKEEAFKFFKIGYEAGLEDGKNSDSTWYK